MLRVGKDTLIDQHISNTQLIWQLLAGFEKLILVLKINIWVMETADPIPYLVPTQFQESIFPRKSVQKNRLCSY
jgi:hypothetical protein